MWFDIHKDIEEFLDSKELVCHIVIVEENTVLGFLIFCLRSTSLSQMNTLLREQLDQMNSSKQRLAGELERATAEVHRLRSEQKESQWHKGREVQHILLVAF